MTGNRISDILGSPPPVYQSEKQRHGTRMDAVRNAYMLDTSIGQMTVLAATSEAFGVPLVRMFRRVQPGYSPYNPETENLDGFGYWMDEFKDSTSPEETAMIKQMIENNLDMRMELEGWGGTRLATNFLDPINLIPVPFALGKGFSEGAKVALKRGIPIVAGTEIVRHNIDPTSTVEETIFATLGGSLFMGLIGGAVGKIPKNTITVGEALRRITPPPGTTSMSVGIPWSYGGTRASLFGRATRALKSAVGYGDSIETRVNPESFSLKIIDDDPKRIRVNVHYGEEGSILSAVRVGDELQIKSLFVPEEIQRKGIGSYAVRMAAKYAEDHGLRLVSDHTMTPDALKLWKSFEAEGYNVHENKSFSTDPDGTRFSVGDEGRPSLDPLFELKRQIDPDQMPAEARRAIEEMELAAREAEAELKLHHRYIKELKQLVKQAVAKAGKAVVAGGAKTKATKAAKILKDELRQALKDEKGLRDNAMLAHRQAQDINIRSIELLDAQTVKDWDLLPTGYNKLLGKLDQFPWWRLLKTPLRGIAPDLAVRYQMFALKIASTPGLNNKGNKLKHSTGSSVESLAIIHTGRWLAATREAQNIYRKYIGHGASSGQIKHFVIDQTQRVRGALEKFGTGEKPTKTPDGFLTIEEFDLQISIAIAQGGKHSEAAVAKAAAGYVKALKELGDEARRLGITATQKNIARRIENLKRQIDDFNEKWSEKYDTRPRSLDDLEAESKALDDELREFATELGVSDPDAYINLTRRVLLAEKDDAARSVDPDTGKSFTIDELMAQVKKEGGTLELGAEFSRRRGYTPEEIEDFVSWHDQTKAYIDSGQISANDLAALTKEVGDALKAPSQLLSLPELPPGLRSARDRWVLEIEELLGLEQAYRVSDNPSFIHRMWIAEEVKAQEIELKAMLTREFNQNPKQVFKDAEGNVVREHPDVILARVNEAYAGILHEADTGNNGAYAPKSSHKRPWLEARKKAIEDGTFRNADGSEASPKTKEVMLEIIDAKLEQIARGGGGGGVSGPLIARELDLDDVSLLKMGLIEGNVNTWMQHYVSRTAPMIETARMFGDARAQQFIDELISDTWARAEAETDPKIKKILYEEAEGGAVAMNDLRDIVHGTWQIPTNPDAITPRILRMLRNFNILGAMGRSVMMALGDIGNVVVSQGFTRSLGHAFESFASGITDGSIKMMRNEVDLAGSVSEVILGMRYHQMTDFGIAVGSSKYPGLARFERGLANASQRFFLYNLLGPWTDMARRFSGGMLQSKIIENSLLWRAGNLADDEITIMTRLGINEKQAIQFAEEWEASGKLKHGKMYIANTSEWVSEQGTRTFRAALNTEINRMVPTPGAVDKPKGLLKGEWWKVIGQYRGFSIAATHRIMGAGIHQKGAQKYSGLASMVGIAMMVDAFKRPDYIQMPFEEQILRAVELSAVTGIILDLNDTLERATAGAIGIRPMLGMDIRERSPNWANRMGTLGAVPNQWLTLMYGLTADEAETDDLARAIRYMIPYNNLLWWNEAFTRAQRASVDFIEDREQ